jgi:hypothetical protein
VSRRDIGLVTSAVGALILSLALFAPWYGLSAELGGGAFSAWQAFSLIDMLLLACGVLGGGLALGLVRGAADMTMLPAIHVIGGIAVAVVLYRIAVQPEPAQLLALRWGPFVALIGASMLAVGPWRETRRM